MEKSILKLDAFESVSHADAYRAVVKTQHCRTIFISVEIEGNVCTITNCFYTDRNQTRIGDERYRSKPLKLKTLSFPTDDLLSVIETELDKKFYGLEFVSADDCILPLDEYLQSKVSAVRNKYHFLIMVGDGNDYNGLPALLRTRLKNKLHRSIYIELAYYKDGIGVVKQCRYYDRQYKRQDITVTPPQLVSCFFPYNNKGILDLLNYEIYCDFTHIIITSGINIDSDTTPLCGAI